LTHVFFCKKLISIHFFRIHSNLFHTQKLIVKQQADHCNNTYQTKNIHHSVRVKNDKIIPIPTSIAANSLFNLNSVATIAAVIIGGIAASNIVMAKINPLFCAIKK
jgi:hypothetical protein